MSLLFDDSTSDYLERTPPVITAAPFSMSAWIRTDDAADNFQVIAGHGQATADEFFQWRVRMTDSKVEATAESVAAGVNDADSTAAPTVDVWTHVGYVTSAVDSRASYVAGGNKGTNAGSCTPLLIDASWIAQVDNGSPGDRFSGNIAHLAIWSAALSDSEIASLAAGVSPLRIRRDSLIHYWPLNGQSPELDIVAGANMVLNGTPTLDFEPPTPHSIVAP